MTLVLTPGQRHESTQLSALMVQGAVKRPGQGRPRLRPDCIVGDKGYSFPHIRRYLRQRGVRITIARKCNQHRGGPLDKALYRLRNRVERLINRMKHLRRLAIRYEKRAANCRTMWLIAAIILGL